MKTGSYRPVNEFLRSSIESTMVPGFVGDMVLRCLQADPARRLSAAEILNDRFIICFCLVWDIHVWDREELKQIRKEALGWVEMLQACHSMQSSVVVVVLK